jgi:hypothetical protein
MCYTQSLQFICILYEHEKHLYNGLHASTIIWFKSNNPNMHYIHKIHSIANNMNVAMELANPAYMERRYLYVASYSTIMGSKNIKLVISYTLKTTK